MARFQSSADANTAVRSLRRRDVSNLATQQRRPTPARSSRPGNDANDTWTTPGSHWSSTRPRRPGSAVQILDQGGRVVEQSNGFHRDRRCRSRRSASNSGQHVGTAVVRITGAGLGAADRGLKTALLRAIAGAAGLAALLALLTGLAVARRITRR